MKHIAIVSVCGVMILALTLGAVGAGIDRTGQWTAELYIMPGPDWLTEGGIAGATMVYKRPLHIFIEQGHAAMGGVPLRLTVRHEMMHALGWVGHPFAGADDVVTYMDLEVPDEAYIDSDYKMPVPSALEIAFVKASKAVIYVTVNAETPNLQGAVEDAIQFWNEVAGRELFRLRPTPATMNR